MNIVALCMQTSELPECPAPLHRPSFSALSGLTLCLSASRGLKTDCARVHDSSEIHRDQRTIIEAAVESGRKQRLTLYLRAMCQG